MKVPIDEICIKRRYRKDLGDLEPLASSIQAVGLLQPVVLDSRKGLIAGQRRVEAARMLDWTEIEAVIACDADDALRLLRAQRDENTCRKDFAPSEAVAVGAAVEAIESRAAKERQREHGETAPGRRRDTGGKLPQLKGKTRDKVAAAVGMKARTYEKAKAVVEAAKQDPKRFGPLIKEMDKTGKVDRAFKELRRGQKTTAKTAVPANLPAVTDRYEVVHAEFQQAEVADKSVDWIITDPPYGKEFLNLYGELAAFANRVLKPGGSLLVMVGQSHLPRVLDELSSCSIPELQQKLAYHWTLAYHTPGGQAVQLWDRKVNTFWKPILWFVNGKYKGDWIGDVCSSAVNDNDKRFHEWGQSESGMADLIERFTYPGQTICDPFCGGGTTGVVAVRMNRLFIGIDRDSDAVATTLRRLAEVARA